jgi:hypothetical protein
MTKVLGRPLSASILLMGSLVAICLAILIAAPQGAQAAWSPYCVNKTLTSYQDCAGVARSFNALSAYGENHSVCVWAPYVAQMCSSGPSVTVYDPVSEGTYINFEPHVTNNAAGLNLVHASAWVH